MKTKGTTKKIAEITMAAIPMITPPRVALAVVGASGGAGRGGGGDGCHQDSSPRLSHLVSGTTITVTTRNSTTLPAVDRP